MKTLRMIAIFSVAMTIADMAHADGRPLIWNVSRVGDNGVKLRTGLQGDGRAEPSAGLTTQVLADDTGTISAVPVSIWGRVLLSSSNSPASQQTAQAQMDYDADARRARFLVSEKKSWIETAVLDMVSRRTVTVAAGGGGEAGIAAAQTLRLEFPQAGAALATTGSVDSAERSFTKSLSVEQTLYPDLTLTASLSETDRLTTATMRVDYSVKW
jgi:hypothetical protein